MNIMHVILYTDGGARGNPGPAAIGCIIVDNAGNTLKEHGQYIGQNTNNVAEYTAIIKGLELCEHLDAKTVRVISDSELIVRQLTGKYKVRASHLKALHDAVRTAEEAFDRVTYEHVPRSHPGTTRADTLVNEALDAQKPR